MTTDIPSSISDEGATFFLAVKLYEAQRILLGKAAKLAGYSKRDFMERLVDEGVPFIDYDDPDESGV